MLIRDIFDRILLRSGQFILRTSKVEIDIDSFRMLVEDALAIYTKASPFEKKYSMEIFYPRQFTFNEFFDPDLERKPDWLSEVIPIRYGSVGYNVSLFGGATSVQNDSELICPIENPWDYCSKSGVLTVPYSARYNILAVFHHYIKELDENLDTGEKDFDVPTITIQDQMFFKLLQGMFLQGIGRSRRAFTLNDLPILMDAAEMASEGKELEDEAMEKLNNIQKFRLAMG